MNSRMSPTVCARSPVAIGMRVPARTRASAAAFSGGTGSSIHSGSYGSSSAATRTAVAGVKRPCISISICTSGPTASRTAARSPRRGGDRPPDSSALAAPNGSSLSAR